ncbi:MAG: hypothetical protein AAF762_00295, partial [Pseudomonadota bacterium]
GEFVEFQKAVKGDNGYELITLKSFQPGDPGAAKLWLCNRQPAKWRDSSRVEVTGANGGPVAHEIALVDGTS